MAAWTRRSTCCSAPQGDRCSPPASLERFTGTLRERLATFTRKCRQAAQRLQALEMGMYVVGSTYNFCCAHHALKPRTRPGASGRQRQSPALASELTDHIWSMQELLGYKVAPPPWSEPKRRGRPRTRPLPDRKRAQASTRASAHTARGGSVPAQTTARPPSQGSLEPVHRLLWLYQFGSRPLVDGFIWNFEVYCKNCENMLNERFGPMESAS